MMMIVVMVDSNGRRSKVVFRSPPVPLRLCCAVLPFGGRSLLFNAHCQRLKELPSPAKATRLFLEPRAAGAKVCLGVPSVLL